MGLKVNPDRQITAADDIITESMILINNPVKPADIIQSFCAVGSKIPLIVPSEALSSSDFTTFFSQHVMGKDINVFNQLQLINTLHYILPSYVSV